ncbi:hypothetical protein HPB50_009349 [Hyalomma asiaticum]|uniref:Uncharacterized protein n=1 Tax=Hyalomma asiaticum TaxID=266040 RepID=A0ACB7T408_HYAAI|nr:hypothetical protein HPB50_009349 [Hyalomma asiaticum]
MSHLSEDSRSRRRRRRGPAMATVRAHSTTQGLKSTDGFSPRQRFSTTERYQKGCGRVIALLSGFLLIALTVFLFVRIVWNSARRAPGGCLIASTPLGYAKGRLIQFKINGTSYSSVAFYGIPFGAPPVGDRRFAEPRCAQPWRGLFDGTYKRPPCAQTDTILTKNYSISGANTTEDCLHINVWVPGKCVTPLLSPKNRRAVVFWLYGGSFVSGGNSYDFYDGRYVAGLGDVLVVMPNYRVTSFGFLNSGTGRHVVGNMALYDELLALRWLRDNVHRFGGDSDRILIAGQSAGAIATSMFMMSPIMSQYGPYRRAFLMSGSVHVPLPQNMGQNARNSFSRVAAGAGCESASVADTVRCLRNRSAADILKATHGVALHLMPAVVAPLFPGTVESLQGRFLGARARDALISSVGTEGEAFFEMLMPDIVGTQRNITKSVLKRSFPFLFGNVDESVIGYVIEFLATIYDFTAPNHRGWIEVIGDTMFRCPVAAFGRDLASLGKNVYYMQYTSRPSFSVFAAEDATHGDDVAMLFGYPYLYPEVATDEDRAMSYRMMTMVSHFAKDGSGGPVRDCPLDEIIKGVLGSGQHRRRAANASWTPQIVRLALEMLASVPVRALEVSASAHANADRSQ